MSLLSFNFFKFKLKIFFFAISLDFTRLTYMKIRSYAEERGGLPSNSGGQPTAMAMFTRTVPRHWDWDLIACGFWPQLCLLTQDTCIQTTCGSEDFRVYGFLWLPPTSLVLVGSPCYALCASTSSPPSSAPRFPSTFVSNVPHDSSSRKSFPSSHVC